MNAYIYTKTDIDVSCFDEIADRLKDLTDDIYITYENRRSYREYDRLLHDMSDDDIFVVYDLREFGSNNEDILNHLEWFIQNDRLLVITDIPSTYIYGISQPMNKAVINTLSQSILSSDSAIVRMSQKPTVGRSKVKFPDNWEELFEKWESHEISSKEFLDESGLKKATFYNLITEYRDILKRNSECETRYKRA